MHSSKKNIGRLAKQKKKKQKKKKPTQAGSEENPNLRENCATRTRDKANAARGLSI